jgi:hypothetical protein
MEKNEVTGKIFLGLSELSVSSCFPEDGNISYILPEPPPEVKREKGKCYSPRGWKVLKIKKVKRSK